MNHISPRTYEVVKFVCDKGSVTRREVRIAFNIKSSSSTLNRAVSYGLLTRQLKSGLAVYGPTVKAAKFLAEFVVKAASVIPLSFSVLGKRPPASVWEYCSGV